jgi:deoxyribonuclease-4
MIRFGPAGIPLSCKGRTLKDGIEDVHNLGLSALEIQFVRLNLAQRFPTDEEIGTKPKKIVGDLVLKMERKEGKKVKEVTNLNTNIKKGDILYSLASSLGKDYFELEKLKNMARELDIELSLHTPYYMDLLGEEKVMKKSIEGIILSGMIAHELGINVIVTHLGIYGEYSSEEASKKIESSLRKITGFFKRKKLRPLVGLETTGRQEVFGTLDEVVAISKKVKGTVPVLNFAHIHSRMGGGLKKREDFEEVFKKVGRGTKKFHCHFSGVEHEGGNELRYTPIKKGDLRFEPLMESILENNVESTLIAGSPLLEHDAMYMKVIMERLIMRKMMKRKRKKD